LFAIVKNSLVAWLVELSVTGHTIHRLSDFASLIADFFWIFFNNAVSQFATTLVAINATMKTKKRMVLTKSENHPS
jgi:hypothetical protein